MFQNSHMENLKLPKFLVKTYFNNVFAADKLVLHSQSGKSLTKPSCGSPTYAVQVQVFTQSIASRSFTTPSQPFTQNGCEPREANLCVLKTIFFCLKFSKASLSLVAGCFCVLVPACPQYIGLNNQHQEGINLFRNKKLF